ncbi:hypothetical protein [Streptomyces purpureus]|uniref:Uncharacterized protein n=1 Tax=Streptomyces purpureus TaxID=1951 RepID=A0A918HGC0_9ACTN|nr:hypothetical protein [Streptomyces purpureus]GGT62681.1 hypothetical protein GCM10014713_65070 [Streptomyces purpureus]
MGQGLGRRNEAPGQICDDVEAKAIANQVVELAGLGIEPDETGEPTVGTTAVQLRERGRRSGKWPEILTGNRRT